jgi:copper(I)-binding protein
MKDRSMAFPPANGPAAKALRRALFAAAIASLASPIVAAAAEPTLQVTGAWIRSLIPSRPAAGYFKLANQGDAEVALTGASSPACGMLMLHMSMKENGVEKMKMVKSVPVPAHGSVAFQPGGFHLMCMQPTSALKPGDSVPVTLTFSNGGRLTTGFRVKGATGE